MNPLYSNSNVEGFVTAKLRRFPIVNVQLERIHTHIFISPLNGTRTFKTALSPNDFQILKL